MNNEECRRNTMNSEEQKKGAEECMESQKKMMIEAYGGVYRKSPETQYEVTGVTLDTCEDNWEDGQIGMSDYTVVDWIDIKPSTTLSGLLEEIEDYLDMEVFLDEDRARLSGLEDQHGLRASPGDIIGWKEGKKKLFMAEYAFTIEKVTRNKEIDLDEILLAEQQL